MEPKGLLHKLSDAAKEGKAVRIIYIVGIIGIALIFLSTFFKDKPDSHGKKAESKDATLEYCRMLEEKVKRLVSSITSSDKVEVLITLESGVEYVYANEVVKDTDKLEDVNGNDNRKVQQKDSEEKKHIIVKTEDGGETALLVTEIAPKIRGVAIVCEGGDRQDIAEKIKDAVSTVLDITTKRVSITGINN
ncbi:MAG TPA: hypothetical protein GXX17_03150 [Clostridiales bacterium]|nr:hypothetical protein [Clostridiales bacterium]